MLENKRDIQMSTHFTLQAWREGASWYTSSNKNPLRKGATCGWLPTKEKYICKSYQIGPRHNSAQKLIRKLILKGYKTPSQPVTVHVRKAMGRRRYVWQRSAAISISGHSVHALKRRLPHRSNIYSYGSLAAISLQKSCSWIKFIRPSQC